MGARNCWPHVAGNREPQLDLGMCRSSDDTDHTKVFRISDQAKMQAASQSTGLVLEILIEMKQLSLRDMVLCFRSCKEFADVLETRGFCMGTAWLCASLGSGRKPPEILSSLKRARENTNAYECPRSIVDQVTRFLMDHMDVTHYWTGPLAWAQILYQEPDGDILCEGIKKMLWIFDNRLIKELHKDRDRWNRKSEDLSKCNCGKILVNGRRCQLAAKTSCPVLDHRESITSIAMSPDRKLVATGGHDRTVRIWDFATGNELHDFQTFTDMVFCVAWSPDSRLVGRGSNDNCVRIWEIGTENEVMDPLVQTSCEWGDVTSLAWSPDGKLIAVGGKFFTAVHIWDASTGKQVIPSLEGHQEEVSSMAWSPDGRRLATGSEDRTIRFWDVSTGKETMRPAIGHSKYNPECICRHFYLHGFFETTLDPNCPVEGHTHRISFLSWSGDRSMLVSSSWDDTIRLWNVTGSTPTELLRLEGRYGAWVNVKSGLGQNGEWVHDHGRTWAGDCLVTVDEPNHHVNFFNLRELFEIRAKQDSAEALQNVKPFAFYRSAKVINFIDFKLPYLVVASAGHIMFMETNFFPGSA